MGFGSPLEGGAAGGSQARSPMPGTPGGLAESRSQTQTVQPGIVPVGLAEKLEVDSFICTVDPEEQVTSFTVTVERDHQDFELEPEEIITKTVAISKEILRATSTELSSVLSQVVAKTIDYNQPGDGDDAESTKVNVEGRAKMAVCEAFIELAMQKKV